MKHLSWLIAATLPICSISAMAATVYENGDHKLDIGGRAEARFNLSDENETDDKSKFKDKSRARINIKGQSKINDSLTAFGRYEVEFYTKTTDTVTRYLFAGIDTSYGALSYGQQDSAQVMLTDYTDILATFGGDAADLVNGNKDKRKNNFVYQTEIDALMLAANYIANNEKDSNSYSIAAQYALPFGLHLGAGYVAGKQQDQNAEQFNIVANYEWQNLYLAGLYANGSIGNTDLYGYEAAIAYNFNQFLIQAVYNFQQEKDKATGIKSDTVDYFALEGIYKFNKQLRVYTGYLFEQRDSHDDQLQAGIRYDF